MRILFAALMIFASSIAAPLAPKSQITNQQEVLSKHRPFYANDIDPLWDCDLPTCNWGRCAGALRYSMRHSTKTCIKSIYSLTNGDCAGRVNGAECEGCRPVLTRGRNSDHIVLRNMDCKGLEGLRYTPAEQMLVWPTWTRVLAERMRPQRERE